jgi:hypothetical protein
MNRHEYLEEELAVYEQLDGAARARLDVHLEACAGCREKLAAYQLMDRRLVGLADAWPGPELRARFYTALTERPLTRGYRLALGRLAGVGFQLGALALLLGLVLSVWWGLREMDVPTGPAATPPLATSIPVEATSPAKYEQPKLITTATPMPAAEESSDALNLPATSELVAAATPLATAAALDFAPVWSPQSYKMWSPDEAWVVYWTISAQDRYDYSQDRLHFLNLQTGQSCPYPHPTSRQVDAGHRVGWLDNEQVVVFQVHGRGRLGRPCGDEWVELEDPLASYPQLAGSFSPNGRYLARVSVTYDERNRLRGALTISDSQSGRVVHRVTYDHTANSGTTEAGRELYRNILPDHEGEWLDNERFLINTTLEGALLVHVHQGTLNVAADLFGRSDLVDPQNANPARYVTAAVDPATGHYSLLLQHAHRSSSNAEESYPLLYHSATGVVEELALPVGVAPVIHGRWLALYELADVQRQAAVVRLRPIDPPGNDDYASYSSRQWPFFNADWSRMAIPGSEDGRIAIHSVPDWSLLAQWELPGYGSGLAYHSSPSGGWLLHMAGTAGDNQVGLFVIPFD